jgi:hypothetical protein
MDMDMQHGHAAIWTWTWTHSMDLDRQHELASLNGLEKHSTVDWPQRGGKTITNTVCKIIKDI